jgi:hypothetical protein
MSLLTYIANLYRYKGSPILVQRLYKIGLKLEPTLPITALPSLQAELGYSHNAPSLFTSKDSRGNEKKILRAS